MARTACTGNFPTAVSPDSMTASVPSITAFDTSCFSGEYVTGDVTKEYLSELEQVRNDHAKTLREVRQNGLDDLGDDEQEARAKADQDAMSDPATAVGM